MQPRFSVNCKNYRLLKILAEWLAFRVWNRSSSFFSCYGPVGILWVSITSRQWSHVIRKVRIPSHRKTAKLTKFPSQMKHRTENRTKSEKTQRLDGKTAFFIDNQSLKPKMLVKPGFEMAKTKWCPISAHLTVCNSKRNGRTQLNETQPTSAFPFTCIIFSRSTVFIASVFTDWSTKALKHSMIGCRMLNVLSYIQNWNFLLSAESDSSITVTLS